MEIFLSCLVALLIVLVVVGVHAGKRLKANEAERDRLLSELETEFWELRCRGTYRVGPDQEGFPLLADYIMMDAKQQHLRFVTVRVEPEMKSVKDRTIAVADVVTVEIQQDNRVVTTYDVRLESKKQAALSRAAVGGIVFGPAGAIVGASSAGSLTTGTLRGESETVEGEAFLVIGTTDPVSPVARVNLGNRILAEEWLHRIRGAQVASTRTRRKKTA